MTESNNPFALTEETLTLRFHSQWEPHRQRQLDFYFPQETLINTEEDNKIESWSDSYIIIRPLRDSLPFGTHLTRPEYSDFLENSRQRIIDYAQEQLLYWHLARATTWSGHPVSQIIICENDRYFWTTHIPLFQRSITHYLGLGTPVFFLNRFRLSHLEIELAFSCLCLVSSTDINNPYRLGVSPGDEFKYTWQTDTWERTVSRDNPEVINPTDYYLPPSYQIPSSPLPPSSLPALTTSPQTPASTETWETDPRPVIPECVCGTIQCNCNTYPCICRQELCTCSYRPDTPPTPTEVTLWRPGLDYLPSNKHK